MEDFVFSSVALAVSTVLGVVALCAMRTANRRAAAGEERGRYHSVGFAVGLVSSLLAIYAMGRVAL